MMQPDIKFLLQEIELQKSLMIAVATGGPRIQDVNHEYVHRRLKIKEQLENIGIDADLAGNSVRSWELGVASYS